MEGFAERWRRATVGEVVWVDAAGNPSALSVVPLVDGATPCVALPYSLADLAPSLRSAAGAAFAVTDSRAVPAGAAGLAAVGRLTVTEDVTGEFFPGDLLDQELVKYPPSRMLADSPMLCRENWWWLPRIVVRLDQVARTVALPVRSDADRDALLVRDDGAGLRLDVVTAPDWAAEQVALRCADARHADASHGAAGTPLRGDGAPTLAHGHDYTPDGEKWEIWSRRGLLHGDQLTVVAREGEPGLDPTPMRLLERLRTHRALQRACRRGIAAAERAAR